MIGLINCVFMSQPSFFAYIYESISVMLEENEVSRKKTHQLSTDGLKHFFRTKVLPSGI